MISAPYHPPQKLSEIPSWVSIDDVNNTVTMQASSSSDIRGMTQRIAVPQGETRSVRTSWFIRSDVKATDNGYEGIATDIKCLRRKGDSTESEVTYHNNPWESGDPEKLIVDEFPDWTMINFVDQIPYDVKVKASQRPRP